MLILIGLSPVVIFAVIAHLDAHAETMKEERNLIKIPDVDAKAIAVAITFRQYCCAKDTIYEHKDPHSVWPHFNFTNTKQGNRPHLTISPSTVEAAWSSPGKLLP